MDRTQITVLICENNPIVALDMDRQLQRLGYLAPLRASTLTDVVVMSRDLRPDVIVLDANLKDTHGIDLAREIRDNIKIPTFFLAAFSADILDRSSVPQWSRRSARQIYTALHGQS